MSRVIEPTDRLSANFQISPIGADQDGVPSPMPVAPPNEHALIPICQLGPCVRYHEIRTKFEAAEPQDGTPGPVYTHPTRTCYPSPGVELDLTENPVRDCNLWEPRIDVLETRVNYRNAYKRSAKGPEEWKAYEASWPRADK